MVPQQCRSYAHPTSRLPGSVVQPCLEDSALPQLGLETLIRLCQAETERFYQRGPSDPRFAYELFRRALVEGNQRAWEQIYNSYRSMVERWVSRSAAAARSGESAEFLVVETFIRFWRAIPPERFGTFASLAALLQYLRRCASSVAIDSARAGGGDALPEEAIPPDYGASDAPDEETLARLDRAAFWQQIDAHLRDAAERAIIHDSFVSGLKPRDIYARHPDLFASVNDVYAVKRNVLARLSHDPQLRQLL